MTRLPPAYFDERYASAEDPWELATRWYERRKYALTLAALPRERYARAFEPGCSVGVLTAGLAGRCASVLAWDVSARAVATARRRLAGYPHVRVEVGDLAGEWPAERFDLVVLSEVGYYLDGADLDRLAERAGSAVADGGTLVAVHWRHPVADYPAGGDDVHAALAAGSLHHLAGHLEADFRLDVWQAGDTRSVARAAGLVGGVG